MNYITITEFIKELQLYENQTGDNQVDLKSFVKILNQKYLNEDSLLDLYWENQEKGRSADSVINTLIVHLSKYAKNYSKNIIKNTNFSTQDEFIFLINLEVYGKMTKMELIKNNILDKPSGMLTINRLIEKKWIEQRESDNDKRKKIISITSLGSQELNKIMPKIREVSKIVTGKLSENEKNQLIFLLKKIEVFHQTIFNNSSEHNDIIDIAKQKLQYN